MSLNKAILIYSGPNYKTLCSFHEIEKGEIIPGNFFHPKDLKKYFSTDCTPGCETNDHFNVFSPDEYKNILYLSDNQIVFYRNPAVRTIFLPNRKIKVYLPYVIYRLSFKKELCRGVTSWASKSIPNKRTRLYHMPLPDVRNGFVHVCGIKLPHRFTTGLISQFMASIENARHTSETVLGYDSIDAFSESFQVTKSLLRKSDATIKTLCS